VSNLGLTLKIIRSVCEYRTEDSVWTWEVGRNRNLMEAIPMCLGTIKVGQYPSNAT